MSNSRTPSTPASFMASSSQESFDPIMYWVVVYFTEADRWMTDMQLLKKMRIDIKDRLPVTWTPIDPGYTAYRYPLLVISLDNDLDELLSTAESIIATFIKEYARQGPPFRRVDLFPPLKEGEDKT
ncbi:hypothetical protein N7481_000997 [Penicillium waksmanii]|uniref:uncharacterized protein n=1 Tax=Penicillium waksmanii TaxID=69791 RepID=UPI002546DDD4|nr:uncharacterized protein N7481_000997 [Penicillium waksmanii]KAJ6000588.1 hypothetical protein N7481_000997 [Penicillium waksmanii]